MNAGVSTVTGVAEFHFSPQVAVADMADFLWGE
jgi:hypothetical protein